MSIKTIETKGDKEALSIANVISRLSKKHNVEAKNLMLGCIDSDCKELYVWDWDAGRSMSDQFRTLEIIDLNGL